MIILKKYCLFFVCLFFIQSILSMNHARRFESSNAYDSHSNTNNESANGLLQQEQRQEELLRSAQEESLQPKETEETQKPVISINHELALLNNKEEKSAIAVFEIPNQAEQYILSDVQKERAKEMFEVYANYNRGPHKVIKFRYADPNVLPQTRDQAIFLLYSPYIKMNIEEFKNFSGRTDCPPNEAQKKVIYEKMAATKAIIDRAKIEFEKTKQSLGSEAKVALKEGLVGSTLVKTDKGHCKISDIKVGQVVCCFDPKTGKETHSKITYVDKIRVEDHIQVIINDEIIHVAPEHKFYISSSDAWIHAKDLKDNVELRQLVDPRIQDVKEVAEALDVIRIAVDEKQNFYITDHNILVHNFVIEASLVWGTGAGAAFSWAIIKPTLAAWGGSCCLFRP